MWSNVKCCIRPVGKLIFSCLYVLALYTAAARSMLSRSSCLFDRSSHPYRCRIYYQVLTPFPWALHLDPETPDLELNLVISSCSLKELRIYVVSVALWSHVSIFNFCHRYYILVIVFKKCAPTRSRTTLQDSLADTIIASAAVAAPRTTNSQEAL
jgi:hypothetical protein